MRRYRCEAHAPDDWNFVAKFFMAESKQEAVAKCQKWIGDAYGNLIVNVRLDE